MSCKTKARATCVGVLRTSIIANKQGIVEATGEPMPFTIRYLKKRGGDVGKNKQVETDEQLLNRMKNRLKRLKKHLNRMESWWKRMKTVAEAPGKKLHKKDRRPKAKGRSKPMVCSKRPIARPVKVDTTNFTSEIERTKAL